MYIDLRLTARFGLLSSVHRRGRVAGSLAPTTAQSSLTRQALGPQYTWALALARPSPRACPTGCSSRDLTSHNCCEKARLAVGFPLRCIQRFPLPTIATRPAGRPTTAPPAGRPARSSRTRASPAQPSKRPHRIETELSHDVLNPARVPLSWANSPTLGTGSSPRMRRADIEVPNLAVDVDSRARSACYPRGSFYPLSPGPSTQCQRIT